MNNPSAGTLELVDTLESIDWEIRCEHEMHGKDSVAHGGAAEYVQYSPCSCPSSTNKPVCAKWRSYILANPKKLFACTTCGDVGNGTAITFTKL